MTMLSHKITDLSSGQYYYTLEQWYEKLTKTLTEEGCTPGPMPEVKINKGHDFIEYSGRESGKIFFTWYKLQESGFWEIVCYKC